MSIGLAEALHVVPDGLLGHISGAPVMALRSGSPITLSDVVIPGNNPGFRIELSSLGRRDCAMLLHDISDSFAVVTVDAQVIKALGQRASPSLLVSACAQSEWHTVDLDILRRLS